VKAKRAEARRTPPDLAEDPQDLSAGAIVDGEPLEDEHVAGGDFAGHTMERLVARRSAIEGVSFAGAHLGSVKLRDVRLVRCDLSNAVLRGLEAGRVEFMDCRLIGLKALECRMEDVLVERCDARYAQFNAGVARLSDFIESGLQETDFRGVNLENTRWMRSDLSRADLTGAKLAGADLRGAEIAGVIVNAADLAGAIVSPSQAMDLARLLGLTIR
jgi:uncharacterized protein YjbI with pentapeptide repeats